MTEIKNENADPLDRLRARMKRANERPVTVQVRSAVRRAGGIQSANHKTKAQAGKGPQNKYVVKGGWTSISAGAATPEPGRWSRNVIVKMRYVDFTPSPPSTSGGVSSSLPVGGESSVGSVRAQGGSKTAGYGSSISSTASHLGYVQDRPAKKIDKDNGLDVEDKLDEKKELLPEDGQDKILDGNTTEAHLKYKQNDKAEQYDHGVLFDDKNDSTKAADFVKRSAGDKRQFRIILSPEDGAQVDLKAFTRQLVKQMENDLGTKLDWVGANHYNTDNPHTHLTLRGVRDDGTDLVIHPNYIKHGVRNRAVQILDKELGPRSELDLIKDVSKSIMAERYTKLDKLIEERIVGKATPKLQVSDLYTIEDKRLLDASVKRIKTLEDLGLARRGADGDISFQAGWKSSLMKLGQRHDIYKQMSQHGYPNVVFMDGAVKTRPVLGKVVKRGMHDELYEKEFILVSGADGKVHYVPMRGKAPSDLSVGSIVRVSAQPPKPFLTKADANIQAYAQLTDGRFDVAGFKVWAADTKKLYGEPLDRFVESHVKRMGTLSAKGFAEFSADNWKVPTDLTSKIEKFDENIFAKVGNRIEISKADKFSLDKTVSSSGVTTLDKYILGLADYDHTASKGFGNELAKAVKARQTYLVENKLGSFKGNTFRPVRRLLDTLRENDLRNQALNIKGVNSELPLQISTGQATGYVKGFVEIDTGKFIVVANDNKTGYSLARVSKSPESFVGKRVSIVNEFRDIGSPQLSLPAKSKVVLLEKGIGR
ncbi:type IV secretory pathway VirD2 relaxase [Rheinheimera pacifica]|uniref:DUF3363 domain-containing protein n=1 Tax=Rheinheimera pacifica TaxID=173990 RepID=UPI002169278A|nr:DUF3363 domain-containing protein [Rheinheimera pacifica]MCS4309491.1 type IV secretory pathway VirD2 relaxase [Rheinheimera pacifica]